MNRPLSILLVLIWSACALPALAQVDALPVAEKVAPPMRPATADVRFSDAMRSAARGEGQHKGRLLLLWVRQRAERHLKVTVR